jgi:ketosteroid isomerase-like protein
MSNVSFVRGLYDAFARGDVPAVIAALDPAVEWRVPPGSPYGGTYRSPEAVLGQVFARLASEWEGWRMDIHDVLDAGETVVVLGTESGTHRATGRSARAMAAHVLRVRGGKVVEFTDYVDTAEVAKAL